MAFAVELHFDAEADARVRGLWRRLAELGLPSLEGHGEVRPHLSLALFEDLEPAKFSPLLDAFARETAPVELWLSAAAIFPGDEGVVYLAPSVGTELAACHADFHARIEAAGLESHAYYRPGRWVPHCTVGQGVPRADLPRALMLCAESDAFGPVTLCGADLLEFPPVRERASFRLAGVGHNGPAPGPDRE